MSYIRVHAYGMALVTRNPVGHFAPLSRGGIVAKVGYSAAPASLGDVTSTSKSEEAANRPAGSEEHIDACECDDGYGNRPRLSPVFDLEGMTSTYGLRSRPQCRGVVADELDCDNEPSDLDTIMGMAPPVVLRGLRSG